MNATMWKDISGNGNDLSLLNGAHFDSNSLITADRNKITADAGKKFPYNTIEVCAFFDSSRNSSAFVACGNSINTQRLLTASTISIQTHSGNYQIMLSSPVQNRSTWAASYVSTYGTPYVNGVVAAGTKRNNIWDTNFRFGLSGRPGANGNWNFVGNYYCVRLYSRALTADEIAYNYSIDKARFNLP